MPEVDPNFLGPIQGVPGSSDAITSQPPPQQTQTDSIQASDEIAALAYLYAAAPQIKPPDYDLKIDFSAAVNSGVTAEMASKLFNRMDRINEDIVRDMLDSWLKSIEEQTQRVRDWMRSPAYQEFIQNKFPDKDPQLIIQEQLRLEGTRAAGIEAAANYSKSGTDPTVAAFAVGSLIIGAGMVSSFLPTMPVSGAANNVVLEAMPSFQNLVNDPNLIAQLGFIGGMISAGAANTSVMMSVMGAAGRGQKLSRAETYREYAAKILNLVKDPSFGSHILFRIIDRMPGGSKMSEAVKNQMVAIIRTVLLATALASLYQGETKWLGEETEHLLRGDLEGFFGAEGKDQPLRQGLAQELQANYAILTESQRESLIRSLSSYYKSRPTLQGLRDIGQTFEGVANEMLQSHQSV